MSRPTSLGTNITAEAINNFFTLKPLCTEQHKGKISIHRPGIIEQAIREGTTENRWTSGSNDVYTVLKDTQSSTQYGDL